MFFQLNERENKQKPRQVLEFEVFIKVIVGTEGQHISVHKRFTSPIVVLYAE